jgi:hypothetical protein
MGLRTTRNRFACFVKKTSLDCIFVNIDRTDCKSGRSDRVLMVALCHLNAAESERVENSVPTLSWQVVKRSTANGRGPGQHDSSSVVRNCMKLHVKCCLFK